MARKLSDELTYQPADGWAKLPQGWSFLEVSGVAVDSRDNVYVLTRGEHPVIVFDREGNFLRAWGEGYFTNRPHGIHVGPDGYIYCVDDGNHTVRKFTADGRLEMTIGEESKPAPKWSGQPFNRPTHVAVSARTGELYITDGYGNARVHKFSPDGKHILSWGSPGIDPGQFMRPHNIVLDADDNVYVADRENHRIQVFDSQGRLQAIWQNIHRPAGICMDSAGYFYIGELNAFAGLEDCPGLGHRVSIYNLKGELVSRYGDPEEGEGPGQFIAPHAIAVDSRGDLYVGEVSHTIKGSRMNPPRELRSLQKLVRQR